MKAFKSSAVFLTLGLALSLVVGACAKRPVVPVASAPAPAPSMRPAPEAPAAPITPPAVPATPPVAAAPAPAPRPTPVAEFRRSDFLKTIHFDFDKAAIRPVDAKVLDANAAWLKANPGYAVMIEGHCDERGTNEYNLALGDRRATAAMTYLAAQGVRPDRMSVKSYGEERPACSDHNEACWQQNRRADFLVKEQ